MIATWSVVLAVAATATGFDHFIHEGRVVGSGTAELGCAHCHTVRDTGALDGAPGHSACFGECHGTAPERPARGKPYPLDARKRRLCTNCHAPDDVEAMTKGELEKPAAAYPPYAIDRDYALTLPHDKHVDAPCTRCHVAPGTRARKRRAHDRCTPCHARPTEATTASMTDCTVCHRPAFGPAVGPALVRGLFPVTGAFDHTSHRKKLAPTKGDECLPCHDGIAAAGAEALPAPTMASCARCHDGESAFATTATRCRSCHRHEAAARPSDRRRLPFSHVRHADLDGDRPCGACHGLADDGAPLAPGSDHRPCADSPCHADDFASSTPRTCGTCHVGNEPWRRLRWFGLPRRSTEFGVTFSHAAHAVTTPDCRRCHTGSEPRRPVDGGHTACSGATCHRVDAGVPPLSECERCHTLGSSSSRGRIAAQAKWSVRALFDHDRHDNACVECHVGTETAETVADIARPAKQRCATCHDGAKAFKMTGHGCSRCHAK